MAWTLKEIMDSLPPERRKEINRRYEEFVRNKPASTSGKDNLTLRSVEAHPESRKDS